MKSFGRIAILLLALIVVPALPTSAQERAEVLVTSSGQALDAFTVKTLASRAGVENDYDPHAMADDLDGRRVVVIAMGASVKGFGAAGITAETELARTEALLDAAKANGVKVVGVHIGGAERRKGLSEQFVKLVSGGADSLIVWETGNEDGYFNDIAAERGIPLILIGKLTELGGAVADQVAP